MLDMKNKHASKKLYSLFLPFLVLLSGCSNNGPDLSLGPDLIIKRNYECIKLFKDAESDLLSDSKSKYVMFGYSDWPGDLNYWFETSDKKDRENRKLLYTPVHKLIYSPKQNSCVYSFAKLNPIDSSVTYFVQDLLTKHMIFELKINVIDDQIKINDYMFEESADL
jgi:hypothetical protein